MKKILLYLFIPFLFACTDDAFEPESPADQGNEPEGKARIGLDISSGNFHKPTTKTKSNDVDFSDPYLLSFKLRSNGSVTDTILTEVVKTTPGGGKHYAVLTQSQEPHLIILIANADELVEHRLKNHYIIGKRYAEAMPLFTFGAPTGDDINGFYGLKNPTTSIPFVTGRIPMWAKFDVAKIEKGISLSENVYLQRIVSKLYLDATRANTKDNFTLTGFTVLDVPSHAYIDNDGAANQLSPQLTVNYGSGSSASGITDLIIKDITDNTTNSPLNNRPVYVFPFRSKDSRNGVYHIIFSGHFGDNNTRYFKLKIGNGKADDPAALIRQNVSYQINLLSIQNNGYESLEDALRNDVNTGLVANVTVADNVHDIVANGKYYMGLSNSEYLLCVDETSTFILTVATLTFGKSPDSNIDMNKIRKSIQVFGGIETIYPNFIPDKPVEIQVKIFPSVTQGRVVIKIGDLSKEITINRVHTDAHPSAYTFPDLSSVEVNWEINENNYQVTGNGSGNVRLQIPENITPSKWVVREPGSLSEMPSSSENFAAEPVFTRKIGKGRVFDKSGLRGSAVIDIRQAVPVYMGWFGGKGNNVVLDDYSYSKRLIMESNEERGREHMILSSIEMSTNLTNKEHGVENTKGMYDLANNNAAIYPAAWNCWIKNDKNGDGIVTSQEAGSSPWYLPAQKQLQAISLTFQATSYAPYWCSTELSSSTGFIVNMHGGRSDYFGKSSGHRVRCVRDL